VSSATTSGCSRPDAYAINGEIRMPFARMIRPRRQKKRSYLAFAFGAQMTLAG